MAASWRLKKDKLHPIHNLPYEFEIEGKDGEVQTGLVAHIFEVDDVARIKERKICYLR